MIIVHDWVFVFIPVRKCRFWWHHRDLMESTADFLPVLASRAWTKVVATRYLPCTFNENCLGNDCQDISLLVCLQQQSTFSFAIEKRHLTFICCLLTNILPRNEFPCWNLFFENNHGSGLPKSTVHLKGCIFCHRFFYGGEIFHSLNHEH